MVNEQVAVFPAISVAVQLTVVVPTAKAKPGGGIQNTPGLGQLSIATGTYTTFESHSLRLAGTEIFAGQVMEGASVSFTVTWNEQDEVLPAPSVAVQVTVVVPTENTVPDAGLHTTTGGEGQLSVAVVK
jgi:hypothetical protein